MDQGIEKKAILTESKCPAIETCPAVSACPEGAIRHVTDAKAVLGGRIVIEHSICTGCGDCIGACCGEAITLAEVIVTAEEASQEETQRFSVKVLGPGCENCEKLVALTQKAIDTLALGVKVERVTEYTEINKYRLLAIPGLVINEKLVCAGRLPSEAEVTTFLVDALM